MKRNKILMLLVLCGFLISGCTDQNDPGDHHPVNLKGKDADQPKPAKVQSNLALPEHLRLMLQEEMKLLQGGMGELLGHLAQGRQEESMKMAEKVHNSFILKHQLSKADLKQLISLLPPEFVQMDRAFHGKAQKIAESVQQNDYQKAVQLYGEMAQACVTCHAQFAAERFPALVKNAREE